VADLEKASQAFDSEKVEKASERIAEWLTKNCTGR
jgi:hypothetical protein